jgi:hypothetical protein
VEKDEMKSDDRPTKLSGRDSDRVGREGNDRDAETSISVKTPRPDIDFYTPQVRHAKYVPTVAIPTQK